jgi:hypothetical protein
VAETAGNWLSARVWLRPALAALCFAVFALAVLALHQDKTVRFEVEEDGPIPAGLSHFLFGTPLGFTDAALIPYFQKPSDKGSTAEVIEQVVHGDIAPTHDVRMPHDGVGIGPPLSATLAFALFGLHARALSLLFLALIGISAISYIVRFRNERLWVEPVYLAALTFLLLAQVTERPGWAGAAPLGGERSYILVAILPVLHWCFELVASRSCSRREALVRGLLLAVQVIILGFAILVRYSPICFIPAMLVSALLGLRYGSAKRAAVVFLLPLAGLIIALYAVIPLAFRDQADAGRLRSPIWHRAFMSYGVSPEWPFPGVIERYACPQIPEGIKPHLVDRNGHCVWWADPMNQSRPAAEVEAGLYGVQYEAVLRRAFFDVLIRNPGKALATFLYYKPLRMLYWTGMSLIPWPAPPSVAAAAALQLVLLAGFLGLEPASGRGLKLGAGVTIAAALVVSAFIPHLLAWSNPATGQELAAGVVCGAIISVWLGCRAVLRQLGQRMSSLGRVAR